MVRIIDLKKCLSDDLENLDFLTRPSFDLSHIIPNVQNIIDEVKNEGDAALKKFTAQFDKINLDSIKVTAEEINEAEKHISPETREAIDHAIDRIYQFHKKQMPQNFKSTYENVQCDRIYKPLNTVGLYIPGGSAPLVSTVMMTAIPAKIAGCPNKILCTPPNAKAQVNPYILYAAKACGIEDIFKVGGAQAIAAMAYGTASVSKVNKIFGPGNQWVTVAKQLVALDPKGAAIDMPAGPSELMIVADESANPAFVAADLLSQAEHGIDSQVILIATSLEICQAVEKNILSQLSTLPRKKIAESALKHSCFIVINDPTQIIKIINTYAPEHLSIQMDNEELAYIIASQVEGAGTIFMGHWCTESLGDYLTGSNHVLPTGGYARNYSGLSVEHYMRSFSIQSVSKEGLTAIGPHAVILAELESLQAHANAVSIRLNTIKGLK